MVQLRPLTLADVPTHAALLAAAEQVDRTNEHYGEDDLVEEYENPDIELGKDIVGAFDGDALVGYFAVYPRLVDDAPLKVHLEGTVHPDHRGRGVGTQLVSAMLIRADAVHAERAPDRPARLALSAPTANTAQEQLLSEAGLVPLRWNFGMRAQLADLDVTVPPLPDGLTLVTYSPELDTAMRAAHNEVFLDHPEFTPWSPTAWKQWVSESRNFRASLSVLLVADDDPSRVVGYVQTNEFDAYAAATGRREAFIAKVGVRRELRGRGLAGVLLREVLRRARDAGFDESALDVDSENPTGALGVYERAGFVVEQRFTQYALDRPPVVPRSL
jgi:mycothiol synthase